MACKHTRNGFDRTYSNQWFVHCPALVSKVKCNESAKTECRTHDNCGKELLTAKKANIQIG